MLLSIFHLCLCAFLCHCRSFNPSLCRLLLFLLPHVAVSRPCCLLKFTLPGPLDCAYSIFSRRRTVLIIGNNLKFYFEVAMCVLHNVSNNQLKFVDAQ